MLKNNNKNGWSSRRTFLMVMMCQSIGSSGFIVMPTVAVIQGATGYIFGFLIVFFTLGVPLLYMEYIISQFTTRDCIEIWKICPSLTHIGYIYVFWQITMLLFNHCITTFVFHYFMISFEDPIPYYQCGPWTKQECNILRYNYTVNQECLSDPTDVKSYCDDLHLSFPECQYWRHYILGYNDQSRFHIAWRVCLASALLCICMFSACFKSKKSVGWSAYFLALYPMFGYIVLMIGSMLQKGIVVVYQEALDSDFSIFSVKYSLTEIIVQVLFTLHIGTGLSFNLASSSSFRSPCYSNVLIVVITAASVTVLSVCTYAMMTCPYAFEYNIKPSNFMRHSMALVLERTPRLLYEYQNKSFWLLLIFSSNAALGTGTSVILITSIQELVAKRHQRAARYPGLFCFTIVSLLFLATIPTFGGEGLNLLFRFSRCINAICILITLLECVVFVLWYGLNKLSEDVHFMTGVQPKNYMKLSWVLSCPILAYVFCDELYRNYNSDKAMKLYVGSWAILGLLLFLLLAFCVNLLVGLYRKRFREALRLDPTWGPQSELLQRSRAMFSAQAMTKEYMYRQYHLQAGIIERQRRANIRNPRLISRDFTTKPEILSENFVI